MKIYFRPKTLLGKISIVSIVFFFIFLGIFFIFIVSGEKGGDTFFSNLKLSVPAVLTGISGIGAFFTGIIGIIIRRERSFFVLLSTVIGFFVLLWIIMEIIPD